ncbi:MAG: hypothetical protein V5A48_14335, partial [Salinivenus sp.]
MRYVHGLLAAALLLVGPACDSTGPTGRDGAAVRTVYGPSGLNTARHLTPRPDGSLLVTGYAEGALGPADGLDSRPLLLRIGPEGAVADATVYRDIRYGAAGGAAPFGDGLAVLVDGERQDPEAPSRNDARLYQTDAAGDRAGVLFDAPDAFLPRQPFVQTDDGGIVLALSRTSSDALVKLTPRGRRAWTTQIPDSQAVTGVVEARDRDLWVLGRRDARRFVLARLTPGGREQERRVYGTDTLRRATALTAVGDGAAVLQARSVPETTRETVVVTRVSDTGAVRWRRTYATGELRASSIASHPDGGLVFGYTEQARPTGDGRGPQRAYVVRLAPDGTVRERHSFGAPQKDAAVAVVAVRPDGTIIAAGSTGPPDARFRARLLVEQYGGR